MTLNELINKAIKLQEKGYGDLQVRLITDHGQVLMKAEHIETTYMEEDTYMEDEIHEDDLDEWENPIKVIVIAG